MFIIHNDEILNVAKLTTFSFKKSNLGLRIEGHDGEKNIYWPIKAIKTEKTVDDILSLLLEKKILKL